MVSSVGDWMPIKNGRHPELVKSLAPSTSKKLLVFYEGQFQFYASYIHFGF